MQIHELNNYNGNLDSSAYLAVDNGSDTGKVSTVELLADTNAAVSQLDTVLNGRIDNIVAGGEAPSASEIVDARYGADGVTYPSLGAAIRDQVTDLKSALDSFDNRITNTMALLIKPRQLFDKNRVTLGYLALDGTVHNGGDYDLSYYTDYFIDVSEHIGETIYFSNNSAPASARVVTAYDINKNPISSLGTKDIQTYVVPEGVSFVKFTMYANTLSIMQAEFSEITAYQEYFDEYYVANADSLHGVVKANQLELCEKNRGVNRLNPAEVVLGKYISTEGKIMSNDSYGLTGIMEVEEGKTYTLQFDNGDISEIRTMGFVCAYDDNMSVISSSGATYVTKYTVPSGIKYVRIAATILKTYYEQTQFVPHITPIRYIDYIEDRYLILNEYLDLDTIKKEIEGVKEDVSSGRLETANDCGSISFTVPNIIISCKY